MHTKPLYVTKKEFEELWDKGLDNRFPLTTLSTFPSADFHGISGILIHNGQIVFINPSELED